MKHEDQKLYSEKKDFAVKKKNLSNLNNLKILAERVFSMARFQLNQVDLKKKKRAVAVIDFDKLTQVDSKSFQKTLLLMIKPFLKELSSKDIRLVWGTRNLNKKKREEIQSFIQSLLNQKKTATIVDIYDGIKKNRDDLVLILSDNSLNFQNFSFDRFEEVFISLPTR